VSHPLSVRDNGTRLLAVALLLPRQPATKHLGVRVQLARALPRRVPRLYHVARQVLADRVPRQPRASSDLPDRQRRITLNKSTSITPVQLPPSCSGKKRYTWVRFRCKYPRLMGTFGCKSTECGLCVHDWSFLCRCTYQPRASHTLRSGRLGKDPENLLGLLLKTGTGS